MSPPATCYILFYTAINTLWWKINQRAGDYSFFFATSKNRPVARVSPVRLCCLLGWREKGDTVIWSSTITAPQWPGGPQLPDKGLFQYPANMDGGGGGGGGTLAIRYLKHRGFYGLQTWPDNTQITGSSNRRRQRRPQPEHWLIHRRTSAANAHNAVFMQQGLDTGGMLKEGIMQGAQSAAFKVQYVSF